MKKRASLSVDLSPRSGDRKDDLYAHPRSQVAQFAFDQAVVDVFPDMIKRSVPGYTTVVAMTGLFAARYAGAGGVCYDLGCSLGATTLAMASALVGTESRIVGVDNAPAMIASFRDTLDSRSPDVPVELQCADIRATEIIGASVVVLNYTLQFIAPEERVALLARIYDGLLPGGVLILSEKVVFEDPGEQELMTALHLDFKRANGYSEMEISQKRSALEHVLIPDSLPAHQDRLQTAGFERAAVWFQSLNFASLLAMKAV
ncbi:MAG: carboxy-S-adenosyl-L-methionine synthase CmoA [Bacteroidota bacterium]